MNELTCDLLTLIEQNEIEKLKILLQEQPNETLEGILNSTLWNHGGRTLFLQSAFLNRIECVRMFLEHTGENAIDINAKDNQGLTCLHYAIKLKNWNLCKTLLKCETLNPNCRDFILGRTPLHAMIGCLVTDLTDCDDSGNDDIIEVFRMLVQKSDVNLTCYSSKDGALHRLVRRSQFPRSILETVLNADGCDINLQNETGETPLMVALEMNHIEHAETLIDFNADLFCVNKHRETSLHIACRKNQLEIIRMMLSTRICPMSSQDWDGNTALHYAASRGFFEAVQLLVHLGEAPINVKNNYGETALHLAVEGGFSDIVELLIDEEDCDLEARNNSEENVIDIAKYDFRKNLHPTISRILSSAIHSRRIRIRDTC